MTVRGVCRHFSFTAMAALFAAGQVLASTDARGQVQVVDSSASPVPIASPSAVAATAPGPDPSASVVASPSPEPRVVRIAKHDLQAELSSDEVADGSILVVTVRLPERVSPESAKLAGRFEDRELSFYPMPEIAPNARQAVLGIPYDHKAGDSKVALSWLDGESEREAELVFNIVDGKYLSERLRVSPKHVQPRKKDIRRIQRESAQIGKIYRTITTTKYWKGPFRLPVNSKITSLYGTKRVFNGELKSFHQGLDLRAAIGDPIRAAAPGRVVLAKNLFFTGNTVMLDHGYGVYTLYAHMSRFKVRKGQLVKPSTVLGLAGMTGRSSGPHLHWGAVIQRAKVNPIELTKVMR